MFLRRKLLMAVSLILSLPVWGDIGDPVYVSDQPRMTSEAMDFEIDQFKARANYESTEKLIQSALSKRDQLKKEFERAKSLSESGQVTEIQLQQAFQNYLNSEEAVARLQTDLQKSKSESLVAKYRILEEGDPQADLRLKVADALKASLAIEIKNLEVSLISAKSNRDYFQNRAKNGKVLLDKKVISLLDYERRNLDFQFAEDRVSSLESQSQGLIDAQLAIEKNRQRLLNLGN